MKRLADLWLKAPIWRYSLIGAMAFTALSIWLKPSSPTPASAMPKSSYKASQQAPVAPPIPTGPGGSATPSVASNPPPKIQPSIPSQATPTAPVLAVTPAIQKIAPSSFLPSDFEHKPSQESFGSVDTNADDIGIAPSRPLPSEME